MRLAPGMKVSADGYIYMEESVKKEDDEKEKQEVDEEIEGVGKKDESIDQMIENEIE